MIKGKDFAERYFSQMEESEKLFSTGDSELDSLLEEVYYSGIEDGYDYAQKEFAEKDNSTAAGVGVAAAGVGGGAIITKAGKKRIQRLSKEELEKVEEVAKKDLESAVSKNAAEKKAIAEGLEKTRAAELNKAALAREEWRERGLFDKIEGRIKGKRAKKAANKAIEEAEGKAGRASRFADKVLHEQSTRIRTTANAAKKGIEEKASKNLVKLSKRGKILGGAGLAAGGIITASGALKRSSRSAQN